MTQGVFVEVSHCIHCGIEGPSLSDEHIIPMGLLPSGEPGWVLRKASCQICSGVTSGFERAVLRRLWQPSRLGLGLRSYRKRKKERVYPLLVVRNSQPEKVMVPFCEYPATIQFLEFAPPAYQDGRPYKGGIDVNGHVIAQVAGPPVEKVVKKLGVKTLRFIATFERDTYERLLLKIAYGFAVARLGLDGIEEPFVLPAIFGRSNDIGRWLGCDGQKYLNPSFFHSAAISIVNQVILCRVRLFSRFQTPEYLVVVGRAAAGARIN